MDKTIPLEEQTIAQVYQKSNEALTYVIPIYQRNYAWGEDEITALVKDVYDAFKKDSQSPYYIGTLVTYKRDDNQYEVIDGQQRLTTLYIIMKALRINPITNQLTYNARSKSKATLEIIGKDEKKEYEADSGILNGFEFAKNAIESVVAPSEREAYKQYFLQGVHIIHYDVPKDVDLNHYFEVMNSRGEQLEKHEIVKSKLSQHLKDKRQMATFSLVWEACSEMNVYIQQVFSDTTLFGNDLSKFIVDSFGDIPEQDETEGKQAILDLLRQPAGRMDEPTTEQSDKFQPIIDFPNFLLIVLKMTLMKAPAFDPVKFTLDDKELVNEFDKALSTCEDKGDFARTFAFNLLKAKFLLDNYIVHHTLSDQELSGDNPWKLQCYYRETSKKRYSKNIASPDEQKEMVHLLSMFEVSFTPKQRKNYLFYCLLYLFDNYQSSDKDYRGFLQDYLHFLQDLADKYFHDVYLNPECLNERNQPRPNAFDNTLLKDGALNLVQTANDGINYQEAFGKIYRQGSDDIPLFVFNYTDYRLWKKYADELRSSNAKKGSRDRQAFFDELGCSDFELDTFNNFYFSRTRKSLEHFYPQAKAGVGKPLSQDDINCFGNFAMIGAEANSSGSNWDPITKLDHYCDGKANPVSVASLKFKIMMQVCQDNYKDILNHTLLRDKEMAWNAEDMQVHQRKMLNIIIPHDA